MDYVRINENIYIVETDITRETLSNIINKLGDCYYVVTQLKTFTFKLDDPASNWILRRFHESNRKY